MRSISFFLSSPKKNQIPPPLNKNLLGLDIGGFGLVVLAGFLGLGAGHAGDLLVLEGLDAVALGLHLVDGLHKDALVLELVT